MSILENALTADLLGEMTRKAAKVRLSTKDRYVSDMRYLRPQDVFDLLPERIQEEIDLRHFKAVLHASHLLFVEYQHRQVDKNAAAHIQEIEKVKKPVINNDEERAS